MNQNWHNSFHANYNTVTGVQILWKFTCSKRVYLTYISKKYYGMTKNYNMVTIRTEPPIDTNFSVQYGDNSNFDGSEKNI